MKIILLKKEIRRLADPNTAKNLQRFFKTNKGQYGEGDIFLGLKVPRQRQLVKKYQDLTLKETKQLLKSKIHEERLIGLLILVKQYEKGDQKTQTRIYRFYLAHIRAVNNWDLVDLTAPKIIGQYLLDKPRAVLYEMAQSSNLWLRRIAMLSTMAFIRQGQYQDTLALAKVYLTDPHDLIHKATGWLLREIGKKDQVQEEIFLKKYAQRMPRTMLRYALEKLPKSKQQFYLHL